MTLPLPYVVRDPDAQTNFDQLAMQFPLGIQHLKTGIVLQLNTTGTARKVAFGSDSVTFTASPSSATRTVAHGLGATPSVVFLTALNETANCLMILNSKDATNIVVFGRESADVNRTGSNTFYWLAIA